ncbi:hypothetical protein [Ihuprevotella massiliensis]|uniref:hypothetical protein n=1 Tax=Ihuprevotella massiliensis TaxID=1852368 RepID=UPI00114CC070
MFAVFVMLEILPISYLKTTQKAHIANNQVRWRMANPSLLLLQRYIFLPTWRSFISTFLEVYVDLLCKSNYLSWLFAVAQGLEFLENDD